MVLMLCALPDTQLISPLQSVYNLDKTDTEETGCTGSPEEEARDKNQAKYTPFNILFLK